MKNVTIDQGKLANIEIRAAQLANPTITEALGVFTVRIATIANVRIV